MEWYNSFRGGARDDRAEPPGRAGRETLARAQATAHDRSLLEALFTSSPVGVAFLDRDFRYVRISESLAAKNGLTAEEHIGRTVKEVLPDLWPSIEPSYRKVLETKRSVIDVLRGKTARHEGWWHVTYFPVADAAAAEPGGVGALVIDLTDQKNAEEALRCRENFLELFLEQMPAILWMVDTDMRITVSQGSGLGGLDLRPGELVGHTLYDYLGVQDPNHPDIVMHREVLAGKSITNEAPVNGRWLLSHLRPFQDAGGETTGVVGVALDITQRKRFEHELLAQNRVLELIARGKPLAEVFSALLFSVEESLPGARARILLEESAVPDCRFETGVAEPRPMADSRVQPIRSSTGARIARLEVQWPTGKRPADTNESLLEAAAHLAAIALDRRQTEETLKSTLANLKRSNRELEQFASVVSHDVEEPLRMVSSYVGLLRERYADRLDEAGQDFIGFAVDGARHLRQLITALGALARVEALGTDFVRTELRETFERARKNLELKVLETGGRITCGPLPVVSGDATQLVQLFQNLLSNALKFHESRPPEIHVEARSIDEGWEISVRDNGIGIEAQSLERIFVVFQRLNERDRYPGTGVGLTLCKKIVERHGGRIWVTSAPGEGSAFHFTLRGEGEGLRR